MRRPRTAVLTAGGAALVAALGLMPAMASASSGSSGSSGDNAAPASHGYLPLHPDYPQVKAQADAMAQEKAKGSGGSTKGGHGGSGGGGSGGGTGPSLINPDLGWAGVSQTNVTPPDPTGAAGPSDYVQLVNDQYGVYPTGTAPGPSGPLSELFPSTGVSNSVLSDPQILWDPETKRFYYVAIDTTSGNYALLYGFTKTADPAGGFCGYSVISYGSTLPDYPKLGDMQGYLLVGVNDFANGSTYQGSEVAWIAKQPSDVASCPPSPAASGQIKLPKPATPVPAVQADGQAGSGTVVQAADVSGSASTPQSALYVTTLSAGTAGTVRPTASFSTTVSVSPYYLPPSAPQYGTGRHLDTMDGRLEHAVEVGGVVYTAHAVAESAGGMSVERWYGVTASTGAISNSGTLSDPALYVFNGSISPNMAGTNLVLGVSTSGTNAYPAMQDVAWVLGAATPSLEAATSSSLAGTVVEQSLTYDYDFSCSGRNSICRWGDYSGASPDPSTGGVFLTNEYSNGNGSMFSAGWSTRNIVVTP